MRILGRCALGALLVSLALASPASATFPGDNGRISFWRFVPEDDALSIFTTRSDGSDLKRVTDFGPGVFAVFSDWSPDGDRLAIDSDRSGSAQIWILNPDGSGARQLTGGPGEAFDPAWTPDGRMLAIEGAFTGEDPGIFLIPARARHGALVTGAQARRVTRVTDGGWDSEPQVSPNGKWIAFTHFSVECNAEETFENCTTRIFRVRTNGRKLEQLTGPELNASAPDFHPSGRWIAFDTHDNTVAPNAGNIVVMRPDGSDKRVIIRGDDDDFFNNPSFSPDGRQVAFARWQADDPDSSPAIWTARADGRDPHQIVNSEANNKPDWGSAGGRHDDDGDHHDQHHGN